MDRACVGVAVFLLAAIAVSAVRPAAAQTYVDLELILAVDVSGSVDPDEADLQREGYIAAFQDPDVIRAIESGMLGRIAVAYYEWAGFGHIREIVGWTLIEDTASAYAFAKWLTIEPPQTARRTAITSAINYAVPYFESNTFEGTRRVIDISGDGANNWGGLVTLARDRAVAAGVTINGLPIINGRSGPGGWPQVPNLDLYYQECVIGGPGAFIVVANSFQEFATAVRQKLITEIAGVLPAQGPSDNATWRPRDEGRGTVAGSWSALTVTGAPGSDAPGPRVIPVAQAGPGRLAPPCDIGERRWLDFDDY